jgi:hypothetical protein
MMARSHAKKKRMSDPVSEGILASSEPQWVVNMHAHFARTGHYRSEDLIRVLGDQRTQVGPRDAANNLAFAKKV